MSTALVVSIRIYFDGYLVERITTVKFNISPEYIPTGDMEDYYSLVSADSYRNKKLSEMK